MKRMPRAAAAGWGRHAARGQRRGEFAQRHGPRPPRLLYEGQQVGGAGAQPRVVEPQAPLLKHLLGFPDIAAVEDRIAW